MFCGFRESFRQSEMDKVMAYTEDNWNRLEKVNKQSVFAARSHYRSGKWLLQTSIHRQRTAAGLPTFTYILFLIYSEMMMIDALEEIEEGIKVGGKIVKDVRFADDQGMVAGSEGGLQKLMDGLNRTAKEYDMKGNIKKTKVMKVSRKGEGVISITIDGEILEQGERFRYLGALITSDGRCETEIKTRIGMAKNSFNQRKELLRKNLNKNIKKIIIKIEYGV